MGALFAPLLLLVVLATRAAAGQSPHHDGSRPVAQQVGVKTDDAFFTELGFEQWRREYGKVYPHAAAEAQGRANWQHAQAAITEHNSQGLSWQMGHTQFSDLSDEQFTERLGHGLAESRGARLAAVATVASSSGDGLVAGGEAAPAAAVSSIDWVAAGKVTPVKNQGHCGACWAFATVAALESSYAIATSSLRNLSTQDLLSCMSHGSPLNNHSEDGFACGCSGGDPDAAFRWMRRNGIETWDLRPWTNNTASCDGMYDPSPANCDCGGGGGDPACPAKPKCPDACPAAQRKPLATLEGYTHIGGGVENTTVIAAVSKAPVVALVDCEAKAFKNYKSGIISTCDSGLHNHVVLIVGFGEENGMKYWRVKNSFGQAWGEKGYVRIQRDTNMCGIGGELYTVVGAKPWK